MRPDRSKGVARREVRWERMLPDELEAAFAECPVLYFSYGLCEPLARIVHSALTL